MTFGILQRYVMFEVLRAFALALLTMTVIFVLFMVMAEAANLGLSPRDIAKLVPYVIPGTFPYTVPVSLLFAVTVVFGRLASDNEVIAVKTAGVSAMALLWPAILMGGGLSATLLFLSRDAIPAANHSAKLAIFQNLEEMFYKVLKKDREFNNTAWPFLIKVRDVQDRTMIQAVFKHRNKAAGNASPFDLTVLADRAVIKFDMDKGFARVYLEGSEISQGNKRDVGIIKNDYFEIPIPDKNRAIAEKKIQEWSSAELDREGANFALLMAQERKRQAMLAALCVGSGRLDRVDWPNVQRAFSDYGYWDRRIHEFATEKQLRLAQSFGSLVFVLVGAPVGILFARRDFLSAFITCFLPIIVVYYPLMLLGINMGKEDILNPVLALWGGNVTMVLLTFFVLPPVIRH